jgi:hypothetical protein
LKAELLAVSKYNQQQPIANADTKTDAPAKLLRRKLKKEGSTASSFIENLLFTWDRA